MNKSEIEKNGAKVTKSDQIDRTPLNPIADNQQNL